MSKRKRNDLSLAEKYEVVQLLDQKMSQSEISKKLGCSQSQISRIKSIYKEDIRNQYESNSNPDRKRQRTGKSVDVETALLTWFTNARSRDMTITGPILMEKAKDLAKELNQPDFSPSSGWLSRWKNRNSIALRKEHDEKKNIESIPVADDLIIDIKQEPIEEHYLCEDNKTVPIYEINRPKIDVCTRSLFTSTRHLNAEEQETEVEEDYHSIIKNTERAKGPSDKHEFQAETRKLLDIVARSLYSEKEVFIRELISNASDALEKLRYLQMTEEGVNLDDLPLEIHIATDDDKKTFTIQDTGVGMTKEEMIENLGTIARSGSKAFLDSIDQNSADAGSNIIGQFGVGFYSSFMVSGKVDVYSKCYKPDSPAYKWSSDGTGSYDLSEAESVDRGTKIVLHLKGDCYDFAKENIVKEVVKKYSNFVGVPIFLNGHRANIVQALWMMEPKDITQEMHDDFYRFTTNLFDSPRYHLQYKIDAPLNIRSLFYVPEHKPTMFDMSRESDIGVTLYSRKIMIMSKANHVLPRWLRFVKGVVDSEDIPLNLSRELLQDSALIRKLRTVLTSRLLKFFQEQAKKDNEKYMKFYEDYGLFLREGIVTTPEQEQREEICKLLRFESSKFSPGEMVSLTDYTSRMKAGSRNIYYLSAPSRQLAETSPYFEALQKKDVEVLFLYEPYDELVLMQLGQFDKKYLKSIENEIQESKEDTDTVDEKDPQSLNQSDADSLMSWLQVLLTNKVQKIKVTKRLASHPCIITVAEMGAARHFLRTSLAEKSQEERYRLLQPTLEINPSHPLIRKLFILKESNPDLGRLVAEQLYENAMINAGLMDDPRSMVGRLNELLEKALENV